MLNEPKAQKKTQPELKLDKAEPKTKVAPHIRWYHQSARPRAGGPVEQMKVTPPCYPRSLRGSSHGWTSLKGHRPSANLS